MKNYVQNRELRPSNPKTIYLHHLLHHHFPFNQTLRPELLNIDCVWILKFIHFSNTLFWISKNVLRSSGLSPSDPCWRAVQAVIYAGFFGWGGSTKCLGGSDFLRVERNFTIGQSPKIWGNFSKICIKINKKLKNIEKIREKMLIFQKIF